MEDLERLAGEVRTLGELRLARLREQMHTASNHALRGVWLAIVGVTVTVTSAVMVVRGLSGALSRALDGHAWAADLMIGALILMTTVVAYAVKSRSRDEQRLRELRAEFNEPHSPERRSA